MPVNHAKVLLTLGPLLLVVSISGCVRRDGRNSDCTWPGEVGATALDPQQPATTRHLSSDTEFAEELADRYTNSHYGPRSGYIGPPIAGTARHECMVKLFQQIGEMHGVSTATVIASYGRNRTGIDLAEILSFALLFAGITIVATRRIWARYPPAEGLAAGILFTVLCSLAFAVGAVLTGPVWSMFAENIRIGTGHLGPRVFRLPMERYSMIVFAASLVLFWMIAIICRPTRRVDAARDPHA